MQNFEKELIDIVNKFNNGDTKNSLKKISILLNKDKNNIELNRISGQMALKQGDLETALVSFKKVILKVKNDQIVLSSLYKIYIKKNLLDNALSYINNLLKINDKHFEANRDKAYVLLHKENLLEAKKYIDIALKIDPNDCLALNIAGLINYKNNNFASAQQSFKKAIEINKNYLDSYNNLGVCFLELQDLDKAFYFFKKAYKINNSHFNSLMNIANVLSLKDKTKYAINFYNKILINSPNNSEVLSNIAVCYCRNRNLEMATKYFNIAININPNDNELRYAYSTLLLNQNNFLEGWNYFDSRLYLKKNQKNFRLFNLVKKNINIDEIDFNESMLVLREQGIGEEILFSSIYPDLIKTCNNIKIESDPRLVNIFNRSFKKKIFVEDGFYSNQNNINFKNVVYVGSLIKFFRKKESDFNLQKYIHAKKESVNYFSNKLNITQKLKIGISWKSVVSIYGNLKSLSIKDFEPIFKNDRLIINLQYGNIEDDLNYLSNKEIDIKNFKEIDLYNDIESCLGLLQNLNIFVTVSNSTAHFAGALGIKTIIICPKKSSTYYYWNIKKKSSIWYNNVKVIEIQNSVAETVKKINDYIENIK